PTTTTPFYAGIAACVCYKAVWPRHGKRIWMSSTPAKAHQSKARSRSKTRRCRKITLQCLPVNTEMNGRGERIRTSDLSVPNHRFGKKLSFCHFESCSHHEFVRVLRSFPFLISHYPRCAANSVHKLATRFWGEPLG